MHQSLFSALTTLAVALPISANFLPAVERSADLEPTRLRPISIRNYEAAAGLGRRDNSENFSDLDLQTQSDLIYGSPGADGQLLLANMTLYAPDGLLMVLLERFDGLTSAVDCKGDDGEMSLTFNSEGAYNYALQQWSSINSQDNGSFLLIANNDGCGKDDQRQPYIISQVTEDASTLTTTLKSRTAPWSDVASTYDLDFGHTMPYQQSSKEKRCFLSGALCGDFSDSKSVTFNVDAGTPNQTTNIYTDSKGQLKLDCTNCFVSGAFDVTGHISTKDWKLQDLSLTAAPNNFLAALEMEATITASTSPASLQYQKQLFSQAIPGAGIGIDDIFSLGTTLIWNVGVTSSFSGSGTIDFGLTAGLPNSALLTADLVNFDSSSAVGFNGGDITPHFDVKDASASVTLGAYSQPELAFGVSLVKIGDADISVTVKLPDVEATLTAAYEQDGVCSQTPGSSTTGIKLNSSIGIDVDLNLNGSIGTLQTGWQKQLFSWSEPLFSDCFPINIPGLAPSKTSVPTLPPTTSASLPPKSIAYSASGAPTLTPIRNNGTSLSIAPSGIRPSGSVRPTGVSSYPASGSGVSRPTSQPSSGLSVSYSLPATSTPSKGLPSGTAVSSGFRPTTKPSSSLSVSYSLPATSTPSKGVSASGTGASSLPVGTNRSSAYIKRGESGGCVMETRYGKRSLIC